MTPRPLIILGTSGLAREMALVVERINAGEERWKLLGFVGPAPAEGGTDLGFGKILGDDEWALNEEFEASVVAGIGYPHVRRQVLAPYLERPDRFDFPTLVDPAAILHEPTVRMGRGTVITAGCVLTCDIDIGDFNLLNLNATVGHDARIGSYNVINPSVNISGRVQLADGILVGTGAQILEHVRVGEGAVVGAGAMVRAAVAAGDTVVGVPARPIDK